MPWVIFILTVLHTGIISDAQSLTLGMNASIPLRGSSLELSCRFSELFLSNGIDIRKGSQPVTTCIPAVGYQCKFYKTGYNFTSNQTGIFGIIKNLSREADGIWSCRYTDPALSLYVNSNPLNITVYTIPSGLNFTQVPNMNVDLSVTSAQLQCTTSGCTYPSPLIQWLIQGHSASSLYEVYTTLNPTGTGGPCVLPEQFYTSTLDLQQNTTLSDNSDKVLIFSCRIEYPDSSLNLIASGSQTVRFSVRVTEAFLQQDNQNITSTLTVTSGEQVTLTCVTGTSRPAPSIGWFLGSLLIGSGTSLIFTPSNTDHNAVIYCQAYNTDQNLRVDSNKPSLFVQDAPDVKVNISGSTVVGSTAVLTCVPQGNPPQYTFHPWIHTVGQTEIRRLNGVNTFSFSNLSLSNISIQDMGTYICIVDNSITGLNGQVNQMGDTHMYVQGLPIIDKTHSMFEGETSTSASIAIPFYSYPSIKTVQFIRSLDSLEISNTSYVSIYFQPSNITMMFYMKKVMIPGYVAVLHFKNVKEIDFGNYTIQLFNDLGIQSVQFEFIAIAPPSMPKKFFFIHIEDGLLVFGIEKGFNGGREQKFIVEYQPFQKPEATWSTIFKINETDLDNPFSNGTYYIKIPKIEDGRYIFRVYAENRKGNSSAIEGVHVEIKTELPTVNRDIPVGAVVGGVVGAVVLVITIIAVAFFIKRRTLKPKLGENMKGMSHGSKGPEYTNTAFRSDINTTEYDALQSDITGATQYEALNDPESKLNQSSDISISSDPRLLTGEIFYDKLQPCDANQGHMYSSLSSPRVDDGDKKFYENTVMSK